MKNGLGEGIYLILLAVALGAVGQVLLKMGANRLDIRTGPILEVAPQVIVQMLKNPLLLGGLLVFGVSSLLWIVSVSKVQLSLAYPLVSLGYVIVLFASWAFLGEPVNMIRIGGVLVICFGVVMVAQS
ncbi:small multidrug resistance transmembrane protein, putative [Heliomicrobium modesticaldum Ice1]|uniref:Small multidrug resistance transmembrane protein, putative n=1 Tax=Heliobacterium modesticaldum (strain ATCC 51547 / Ice1) TaxID=498761 RepID=B0TFG9_HELMI|nr:EamA family transporter [Heliomicrobium modesticaldum]ABZ83068.1 small multidrug resistance transmembrane protein, putative [Heliomicrobium modesticaldum Ice1]